jgi:leader peptidase (prepilin peptidase)/N-methyltransferase
MQWLIALWVSVFGALIGSFLNVVVYRLPKKEFFATARSSCPFCGAVIKAYDLIPVISFILLRGKCRVCRARISVRYPLIELCGVGMALVCYFRFGFSWAALLSFWVFAVLLCVTLIDFDTREIPDALTIALVPAAVAAFWVFPETGWLSRLIGLAAVSLPMFILSRIIKGAFGDGDTLLMAVCGVLLGWQGAVCAFVIAVLLGGGYAVYLLLSGKSKLGAHIAFAPALCAGVAASLLWGREIIGAYLGLFM